MKYTIVLLAIVFALASAKIVEMDVKPVHENDV
jgi:hypothetical protein